GCGVHLTDELKLAMLDAKVVEQPRAGAEKDRDEVDTDFINEICVEELLDDLRTAHHGDIAITRGGAGEAHGLFDTAGDEFVHTIFRRIGRNLMGQHEQGNARRTGRTVCLPPAYRVIISTTSPDESTGRGNALGKDG